MAADVEASDSRSDNGAAAVGLSSPETQARAEQDPNREQIRRILQSKALRTSEVHRNLLTYLAEKSLQGEGDTLKEYTVGLDVFAKPASYDPRQESVVRMHMARLRQKLAEYYRTEGVDDPILIDVPKGGFKVTFEPRPAAASPAPVQGPAHVLPELPAPSYKIEIILAALLVIAVIVASYFGLRLRQVQRTSVASSIVPSNWTPELKELWAPLLSPDRPLVVCLATQQTSGLTGLATANGAFLLGQFLADRKQNVYLTGSDELSMPEITMGNVVFLGPMNSSRQLQALPVNEELVVEQGGIRNVHPKSGEPAFFANPTPPSARSSTRETYALITHAPGVHGKNDVLYLSGEHVSSVTAGVEAITDPQLARTLVMHLRKPDGSLPRYYQILLKVKSMDDTPIDISYVLHKELSKNP
jgi:hypothetical protein